MEIRKINGGPRSLCVWLTDGRSLFSDYGHRLFQASGKGAAALTFARGRQGGTVAGEIGITYDESLTFKRRTLGFACAPDVLFVFAVAIKTFFITSTSLFHHERKPFLS